LPSTPVHPRSPVGIIYEASSNGLELIRRHFARARVGDQFETDLLTFAQIVHSSAFKRADVNESILAVE
jgi:hypothetical protein